jgi:hypothetical protein
MSTDDSFVLSVVGIATVLCISLSEVRIPLGEEILVFSKTSRPPLDPSLYNDSLRAGRSGVRIPVRARFSAPVQTGPGTHPASCTMGTGSFQGAKRRGVALTTHLHLAPRLRKEWSYTSTPPLSLFVLL